MTTADDVRGWLMAELRKNPGGVLVSDLKKYMRKAGYANWMNYQAVLVNMPDDFPVWEEPDEEGGVWLHILRPGDKQVKRRVPAMKQAKKGVVVTSLDPPAQTKIDSDVHRELKVHLARIGGSMQAFVSQAVRDALAKEES